MATNPTFPDEIIVEILLKLPIKSILRCNTLSKHYYSLIHSQFFIRRHLHLGRLANKLSDRLIVCPMVESLRLFNRRSGRFIELEYSSTPICKDSELMVKSLRHLNRRSFRFMELEDSSIPVYKDSELIIAGPVDGLYCIIDHQNRRGISLWNPATLEDFILPLLPFTNYYVENDLFNILFHQEACLACGFGYDTITNNYKVVIIHGCFSDMSIFSNYMYMYIFDVSKRDWIYHQEQLDVSSWRITTFAGVFLHGACHWLCAFFHESTVSFRYQEYQILAFDMSTELSRTISFPDIKDGYALSATKITTLNKCLALIVSTGKDGERSFKSFNVWIMAEYGVTESWSIMYRVSLPGRTVGRSLGITRDRFYVIENERWLVSYDLDSKNVEHYGILDGSICSLLPYEESLVRIISS